MRTINIEDCNSRGLRRQLLSKTRKNEKGPKLNDEFDDGIDKDTDDEQLDDDFDVSLKEPEIKTTAQAAHVAENLLRFEYSAGNEELC